MNIFRPVRPAFSPSSHARQYELLDPSETRTREQLEQQHELSSSPPATPSAETKSDREGLGQPVLLAIGRTAYFLIPSFLQRGGTKKERVITETSYLNGVRGLAAWLVFLTHLLFDPGFHDGYAGRPDDFIIQLPFFRLMFAGRYMVAIFFILSGYVLSYKPLQLARTDDSGALFKSLSSATFRRTPRLFLPLLPAMIVTAFAVQFSCYGDESFRRIRCIACESTLAGQIWNHALELGQMLNPTSWSEYYPTGLPHFWTLLAEHRGSMVVFLLCLGLGGTRPGVRLAFLATVALFFLHIGRYDTFLFVSGSILAELRVWRREHPLDLASRFSDARARLLFRALRSAAWTAVCVAGLFLGSWPDSQACTAYGFRHLCGITPAAYGPTDGHADGAGVDALRNFWTAIGAFLLLLSMENFEILQRPFTTGLASYMGDISFGFYIVHWTVLFTLGSFLISFFRAWLPYGAPTYNAGYFVGGLVTTIFALWAGDVYWRAFDRTSVKFARWLNGACAK